MTLAIRPLLWRDFISANTPVGPALILRGVVTWRGAWRGAGGSTAGEYVFTGFEELMRDARSSGAGLLLPEADLEPLGAEGLAEA